ncbi:MAG: Gfo/Idh/MocA family oxidoreductase [Verrucomicrobiales bacterium]|nr:Gfo/Idh/MocA family oxidoreductase [Verrucomicrobiales bacterium]MCP5527912.1 Gfo/Idh/MocA family oxidoreductase [Verrucomicrobiales bacterium]
MNESTPSAPHPLTRRRFLGRSAAIAGFMAVPGSVLGLRGATSPNSKLNIAGIGVGGRGAVDMSELASENIVALCDVDWRQAAGSFRKWPEAKRYKDFRKMLEEVKDIDAVMVATPDHVHAPASMAAIKLGKHVYCEKPLTHSVYEARRVGLAAKEAGVATQMGNQGQASEDTRRLVEIVQAGAIGKVREAHIWTDRPSRGLFDVYWPQGVPRPADTPPIPDTLDWDLWLGPAPERPYNPAYLPFKWRGWWDFGTGALGDIGCHAFDPVFRALRLGAPLSVEAASSRVNEETFPEASMVTYHFPARGNQPGCKFVWYDGGLRPPRPDRLPEGEMMGDNGRLLVGDEGFILGTKVYPEARRREVGDVPRSLPRSPGHHQEWINACKGGEAPGSNFPDWAAPLAEVVLLGNVALRVHLRELLTRRKLLWDPAQLRFTNMSEANEYLHREYRAGWTL